jgi:2-(1,2-epoxy-1,2-dihydrophenyl)acetyl-CoA isomerase
MADLVTKLDDGVLVLTMNRPDALNALSLPMGEAMRAALSDADVNDEVGCVVLTGAGRAFCAGGDVKGMAAASNTGEAPSFEQQVRQIKRRMEVSRLLHELTKPTIAMINGVAAGAGLSIALACDMRFCGRSARIDRFRQDRLSR